MRGKKTAEGVDMVMYSLMSEKDTTLYERKIPTAIDSRGSIRSGSSVGLGEGCQIDSSSIKSGISTGSEGGVIRKNICGKV